MAKPIYVLNGPNLNLLAAARAAHLRNGDTWRSCSGPGARRGPRPLAMRVVFRQTNREGDLVDWVQEARTGRPAP